MTNFPPYLKVADANKSMDQIMQDVSSALEAKGFNVLGNYNPGANENLAVIAYSRNDLQELSLKVKDRGALASVLKIGFVNKEGKITVSMLNPMYLFYAYFRDEADAHLKPELIKLLMMLNQR